jgi:hypothetical protein
VSITLTLNCLLLLLSLDPTSCHKIKLSSKTLASYFSYKESSKENSKIDQELSMTNGSWYYIKDKKLFEFHPNYPGMLDLTKVSGFNRFIYLESPLRVLVYPVESNNGKPYVDVSQKKDIHDKTSEAYKQIKEFQEDMHEMEVDDNSETIFENKINNKDVNALSDAFSQKIKEVFGDNKAELEDLKKRWNNIPRYYPDKGDNALSDSYNNYFFVFKTFRKRMEEPWNITWKSLEENTFWGLLERNSFIVYFFTRVMNFMYFNDEAFLFEMGIPLEKQAMGLKVKNNWETNKDKYFYNPDSDTDKISDLREKMISALMKIGTNTVKRYLSRPNFDYYDTFLKEGYGRSLKQIQNDQWVEDFTYPKLANTLHKYREMLANHSDLMNDLGSPYSGEYKEEMDNLKGWVLELFDVEYENMGSMMEESPTPQNPEKYFEKLDELKFGDLKKAGSEVTEEGLVSKFSKDRKDEYVERLKNADLHRMILEILYVELMPFIKLRFENKFWCHGFIDSMKLADMNMNPYTDAENLVYARQLAVIFGELPIDPAIDRPSEHKDVSFLDVVEDSRLLI